jgi:hypothetical protein
LVPTFMRLIESEMHVLLRHADFHSTVWGQYMAELSELLRSRSYGRGTDDLEDVINPKFSRFLDWVQLSMKGEADYEDLKFLKESYVAGLPARPLEP